MRRQDPIDASRAWRPLTLAVVAFLAAATAVALPSRSRPQAAADAPKLAVEAGVRGWHDPGDHVVVTATVESSDLLDGRVDVLTQGIVTTRDLAVAGGTTKQVHLVVPTSLGVADLEVRLYRGSDLVSTKTVSLRVAESVELVGVLPAMVTRAGQLPEQVRLATGDGQAQIAALPIDVVSLGAAALEAYDSIVGTSADLGSLQPGQRAALLAWLNQGGRLLLDDGTDLSALPAEWRPGPAGYSWAGRGEVRVVDGRASAGAWAALIEPSGSSYTETMGGFFGGEMIGSVAQDLAGRAGVELPSLAPLLIPLVAYCLVASVALYVVLRLARRLTLAWVAIPLVAVLTATGVVLFGGGWRDSGRPAATAFVDGFPGGGTAQVSLLAFSRDGGTVRVTTPAGWQGDLDSFGYGYGYGGTAPRVLPAGDGTTLSVRLEAGQVTTATMSGPTTEPGLVVSAQAEGDEVVGTVTNRGTAPLTQVAVFSVGGVRRIGTLAPGQSASFTLDAEPLPLGFALVDQAWDARTGVPGEIAEFGVWGVANQGRVMYPSGYVRAAGWTAERPGDASMSGGVVTHSVVTALGRIMPPDGQLPNASVRSVAVRSPFGMFGNGTGDFVFRYLLPPERASSPVVVELPVGLGALEVWNGSAWTDVPAARRLVAIPSASVRDGVVLVRIPNDGQFFGMDIVPQLHGTGEGA